MNRFSSFHPITTLVYLMSVLVFTMFLSNPVIYVVAFFGGLVCFLKLRRNALSLKDAAFYILVFLLVSVTNPLFSHSGVTILFFINSNPVTLEAVLYGVSLGIMLLAVLFWFRCFNVIMTEDKLLYLFARLSPRLALLISSALRFIPMMKNQSEKILNTQKVLGSFSSDNVVSRLRCTVKAYSALVTWGLEKAVQTGASMKARGYGLKGRTAFSIYTFSFSDVLLLTSVLLIDGVLIFAGATGGIDFSFYPCVSFSSFSAYSVLAFALFFVLCMLPLIIEVKEEIAWSYYSSKI